MHRLGRLVCLAFSPSFAAFCGTISLEPSGSGSSVPLGSPVEVHVNVSGVSDLFGWQFDIGFNPAVLSVADVNEGGLFGSVGVFFNPGIIDSIAGTISFIADSLTGSGPGISTNGTLAVIRFDSIGSGLSNLSLSNVILLDSSLGDTTVATSGSSVSVLGSGSAVPEPVTFLLGLSGIAAFGLRLRGKPASARKRGCLCPQ
jgi:hypothetical protein